jgi:hypothetical protein
MKLTGENRSTRGKTCPSATLSITNPTWTDPGSNPGLHCRRPEANRLSHSTALSAWVSIKYLYLWRRSVETCLLISWDAIPLRAWMFSCCVVLCCVGSGLCDELITCPEGSYRACVCLILCDLETSTGMLPRPKSGCCTTEKKTYLQFQLMARYPTEETEF